MTAFDVPGKNFRTTGQYALGYLSDAYLTLPMHEGDLDWRNPAGKRFRQVISSGTTKLKSCPKKSTNFARNIPTSKMSPSNMMATKRSFSMDASRFPGFHVAPQMYHSLEAGEFGYLPQALQPRSQADNVTTFDVPDSVRLPAWAFCPHIRGHYEGEPAWRNSTKWFHQVIPLVFLRTHSPSTNSLHNFQAPRRSHTLGARDQRHTELPSPRFLFVQRWLPRSLFQRPVPGFGFPRHFDTRGNDGVSFLPQRPIQGTVHSLYNHSIPCKSCCWMQDVDDIC